MWIGMMVRCFFVLSFFSFEKWIGVGWISCLHDIFLYFFQMCGYSCIPVTYVVLILLFNVVFVSMLSGCWFLVAMIFLTLFRVIFLKFCVLKFLFLFSLDLFCHDGLCLRYLSVDHQHFDLKMFLFVC